ncbi:MAG: hypothetical protein AB8F95_07460, partial [Bacteroidia bacterium]
RYIEIITSDRAELEVSHGWIDANNWVFLDKDFPENGIHTMRYQTKVWRGTTGYNFFPEKEVVFEIVE